MACWQGLLQIFKIQDGGRPPFWNSLNRHISVKNRSILMNFGTLQQMVNQIAVSWPIEIFIIQDGGGRHLENRFFDHNSSTFFQFQRNFVLESRTACWQGLRDKSANVYNSRWRTAAILNLVKSPYFSEKLSDFDKVLYTTSDIEPDYSHVTKNWNFWSSRWQRPPSWNSLFWP